MATPVKLSHIAPCGMDCRLCFGFVRPGNRSDGCLTRNTRCRQSCTLRYCDQRNGKYCDHSCPSFPCRRLKNLDQRYRTKYGMSMLENLAQIEGSGIRLFVRNEKTRWACPACGELLCVHRAECLTCGTPRSAEQGGSPANNPTMPPQPQSPAGHPANDLIRWTCER